MISKGILIFFGLALIGFALALGQFQFIGLTPNGGGQFVLIGVGVLLIALALLGRRLNRRVFTKGYQQLAVILLNLIVFLVACEMLVILSFNLQFLTTGATRPPERDALPGYSDQSWHQKTWEEYDIVNTMADYSAYDLWQRREYHGEFINVLSDGARLTPGAACETEDAYRIYAYGGSTMWGVGTPDAMTIPGYLQAALNEAADRPVCIVNYGELGNVSTQGVIRLIKALQRGDVPDMVIFYDGVNDVIAADQTGKAGMHRNLSTFQNAMRSQAPLHPLLRLLSDSYAFTFVRGIIRPPQVEEAVTRSTTLSDDVVEAYLTNYRIVQALAEEYGFEAYFFWQPVMVVGDKPLTPEEQQMASVVKEPLLSMYRETWAKVAEIVSSASGSEYERLYDIADIFDGHSELLYFDHHHLIPPGNEIAAAAIYEVIAETVTAAP